MADDSHLIPLDKIKRLGIYTTQERIRLLALFERLSSLIDSQYQLIDGQKIIIKLLRQGEVELTSEGKQLYSEVPEGERDKRLFLADLIQLVSDIGTTLWRFDHSEHLRSFASLETHYWLKELSDESGEQISGIFDKEKIAKFQREVLAPIRAALKENQALETTTPADTSNETSSAVVDEQAVAEAVIAHTASSSRPTDAGTDTGEKKTEKPTAYIEPEKIRLLQFEQQNLIIRLQLELFENLNSGFTSKELDQMWSDFESGLNAELLQFLLSHRDLTDQLLAGGAAGESAREKILQQFLQLLSTNQNIVARLGEIYEQLGELLAESNPIQANEFEKKLNTTTIAGIPLATILGEEEVSEIISRVQESVSIRNIPHEQPETITTKSEKTTTDESEFSQTQLSQLATEYLTTHAEYEVFRKTRICLQSLPPELDLSAQNLRQQIAEFAQTYVRGLTDTQLRFLQSDPAYAQSFYQRFLGELQQTNPEVGKFLSQYHTWIAAKPDEQKLFEKSLQQGILIPPNDIDTKTENLQPRADRDISPTTKEKEAVAKYLTTHAEYEVFRKTRIYLQSLPPELDLSAQNLRQQIAEFAQTYVRGLTDTQLRFLQSDPKGANELFEHFLKELPAAKPEITHFFIQYGQHIEQVNQSEAAIFEQIYKKGIFRSPQSSQKVLASEIQISLKGSATPIVVKNIQTTLDAMILEFGNNTSDFIKKIPIDRLELIFGLATGTLTRETVPIFLNTLQNQIELRLSELKLTNPEFFAIAGFTSLDQSKTPAEINTKLEAIPPLRSLITKFTTTETVVVAMTAKPTAKDADRNQIWAGLSPEEKTALSRVIGGTYIVGEKPVNFDSIPLERLRQVVEEVKLRFTGFGRTAPSSVDPKVIKRVNEFAKQVRAARAAILLAEISQLTEAQKKIIAAYYNLPAVNFETATTAADISPIELSALSTAALNNPEAVANIPPGESLPREFVRHWNNQDAGKSTMGSLVGKAGSRVKKQLTNRLLKGAATKLGLSATGVGLPAAAALAIWQNKTLRKIAAGTIAVVGGQTLYALTTMGGMLGAALGGFVGSTLGPGGTILGAMTGANIGAHIWPTQWTNFFGWTPHAPVSPFSTTSSTLGHSSAANTTTSLRGMRALETSTGQHTGAATTMTNASQQLAANTPTLANGSQSTNIAYNPSTTAASSSSLTSFLGTTTTAIAATGAPLLGIGVALLLSIQVLFIIYGAFLVRVPSEGVVETKEELSKYAILSKQATPKTLENKQSPAEITYKIKLAPKPNYQLQVTQVKDRFSYQGCDKNKDGCPNPLKSPLSIESFSPDIISTPDEISYTTTVAGKDVMVINSLTITFDVFDSALNKIATNETVTTIATLVIGKPKIGCFVFGEGGVNVGSKNNPTISQPWPQNNVEQTQITTAFATHLGGNTRFTSLLCAKGPITLYRLSSSQNYYGWAMGEGEVGFYSGTFANPVATEYTLVHELGHIIDYRNAGLRSTFISLLPSNLYNCFDYPIASRCRAGGDGATGDIEAFAEAIARYTTNYKSYNFKQKHPKEYAWLRSNIFGGVEY